MDKNNKQTLAVDINPDNTPILYTDNIIMSANKSGLVLDICQRIGQANRIKVVSRIGMSLEQAKKFVQELGKTLAITEGQKENKN